MTCFGETSPSSKLSSESRSTRLDSVVTAEVPPEPAVGIETIRRQNPHERPAKSKKSPAPLFHAGSKAVRRAMHDAYRIFVEAYRHAATRLRAGDRSVKFPEGCFPPRLPFVRIDAALPSSRAGPAFAPI